MRNIKLVTGILLAFISCPSCQSQLSSPFAPEPGTYGGSITNLSATYQYGYNAITGFGIQNATQVQVMNSPFGNMILTSAGVNKGNYSFPSVKSWSGSWQYDVENNKLNFTGGLKDAVYYYHAGKGLYTIQLRIKKSATDKESIVYSYSKKASKEFPKLKLPNGNLTGSFTIKPDGSSIAFMDAKTSGIQTSFTGKMAATNAAHFTAAVGFKDDPHNYQLTVFDPTGNAKTFTPEKIKSWNLEFHQYPFAVLRNDNTVVALPGKTFDKWENLSFTPGVYAMAIADINTGNKLALFPIEYNKYIKPAFLPDGRLVYSPKEGGVAITDKDYKRSSTIYSNPLNALAVSPDGKQIVVSEGLFLYTINLDGSGKKQVICNGEPLQVEKAEYVSDMCWAPDGKYISICYGRSSSYTIVIVPLDGSNYRLIKDEFGEVLQQQNPIMSWH